MIFARHHAGFFFFPSASHRFPHFSLYLPGVTVGVPFGTFAAACRVNKETIADAPFRQAHANHRRVLLRVLATSVTRTRDRRVRIGRWQARWAATWLALCRSVGGVRVSYVFDRSFEDAVRERQGPFIVISNHFGAFDGLVMAEAMRLAGCEDFRPVAKSQVRHVPIMGRAWLELGVAFVKRDHRLSDADAVTMLANVAREDGANVIIFPEGTVLTGKTAAHGARTLLPPKLGGFRRLVRALPEYRVLSVTMYWEDFAPHRLSDEGLVPPGSRLIAHCRVLPPPGSADADRVLLDEWHHKEEWLRSVSS